MLCAITRESLPNQPIIVSSRKALSKKTEDRLPDHEMFTISLETLLSTHFMYGDLDYAMRCVASSRASMLLGETHDDSRRHKKYSGYVVYVAYRYVKAFSKSLHIAQKPVPISGLTFTPPSATLRS